MERPKLTDEAAKEYVAAGGNRCPFCKSTNVTSDSLDADGSTATANCDCLDCGEEWVDTYTLTGVEQSDELSGG